ncbi:hypothetical protein [Cylindrospermopsis raciborskii]|jgi:transposase|nr:hypothetical protein [Cylindrospermopsis raciborskii]UJS05384.1 hypothetical protein L3I90_03810 [Cylindrospermopsis raciborskii KLL07]
MPKTYSIDLRNRVIVAWVAREGSQRQLAERFKVSLSFVKNLVRRYSDR